MKRRRVATGLIAGLMTLGLTACGTDDADQQPAPDPATTQATDVETAEDPESASPESTASEPVEEPTESDTEPSESDEPEEPSESGTPQEPAPSTSVEGLNEDQSAALAGWEEYQRVFEEIASDTTGEDYSLTETVAVGEEVQAMTRDLMYYRSEGLAMTRNADYRGMDVGPVETGSDGVASLTLSYCADFSAMVLVDAETGEPFPSDDSILAETTVMQQDDDGTWRVASIRNEPADC